MYTRMFYIGLFAMIFLLGCQNESKDSIIDKPTLSKPLQTQVRNLTPAPRPAITAVNHAAPKSTAASLGITVDHGKIIIDTQQTKDFFHSLESKMKKSFQKIETTLRQERISSPDETGIVITDSMLQIDLNKTKNFMEKWVRSMESVVTELNKTMGEIEKSLP